MKKRKNLLCFLLSFILLATSCISTNAQALETSKSKNFIINQTISNEIFKKYSSEIEFIEKASGKQIDVLNQYTVKILSRHSALNLDNPNYRFSELMTDITIAYEEAIASNSEKSSTFSVVAPYGAVRGQYITQAAPGVNKSGTAALSISVGESINGKTIGIAYSASTTYSVTGPADGTTLLNGKTATHRVAFLVLFGTLCQNSKGQYYISAGTGDLMDFTTLAHINGYVYCHNTDNTMINYSATISAFKQRIKQYPKHYLALNSL